MNEKAERILTDLLEDSRIKLATLVTVVVFILSFVCGTALFIFKESQWRTNIQRDITETRQAVERLSESLHSGSLDRWTSTDMKIWVKRLKELNDGIKVPEPIQ